jgi:tripartite-type tricarboxylate transporter receptor subunit TctC
MRLGGSSPGAAARAAVAAGLLIGCAAAWAQDPARYPSRPVRIIVPFTPGAGTDIVGRAVAQSLTEAWGHSMVVDNRPGAGGTIAGELVAKANPDGYTLMLGNVSTLAIARSLYPRLPYDPLRDFAPITLITTSENVVVVHPSVQISSVKDLIAYARANPRKLNYGSSGSGTTSHLGGAMFASMAGVEMTHVPYKGSGPMLTDLLAGQLQLAFSSVPTALPHIKAGRLRPLAVTRLKHSATLPDLPTVHETIPGFDISLWQGIVAPSGTPRVLVAKLNQEIVRRLRAPELKGRLSTLGLDVVGNTPGEFAAYMKAEADKWAGIVKSSGARAD